MRRILTLSAMAALATGAVAWATTRESASDLQRLNVAETTLSVDQGVNLHRLSRLLSVLEQLRRDPPPPLVVSPQDAKDAVRAAILVKAITPQLAARAQTYAVGATEVMRQRRLAAVQSEALFERDSLAAEALPEPDNSADLRIRGTVSGDDVRLTPPARLVSPVQGRVLKRFGDPLTGGGRSNGLTLAGAADGRVVSPAAGVVQYVGPVKGWGVIVILRLAGGYHLVLAGLEKTSVQVGQSVAESQSVGWTPEGRQSTSELYLEVREQGSPVDPMRWLNKKAG